jgi:SNF2 family DNA or RNA helicase
LGLNLQHGGSNIVWLTLTYSYESYDQTCCRLIRTGQTKPTTVWRLIVPNSIDEAVAEALRSKQEGQNALFTTLQNLEKLI